jgi:hypothetical protein
MHDAPESLVPIDWHPNRATLRTFGCAAALLFAGLGYANWHGPLALSTAVLHTHALALTACACAALSALLAWYRPSYHRPLYLLVTCLSFPLAWLSAWLLLLGLFFLVITPVSLVWRVLRRPSPSTPRRAAGSAWRTATRPRDKSRYFRQF